MFEVYMEDLVDLCETKQFCGNLQPPSATAQKNKRGTDDWVRVDLKIENGVITEAVYSGFGSVLSQGVAAYVCSRLIGKSVEDALRYDPTLEFRFNILPNRRECAMLGIYAFREALYAYTEDQGK